MKNRVVFKIILSSFILVWVSCEDYVASIDPLIDSIEDERINLLNNDEIFLKFICEMVHPVVRSETEEVEMLLNIYN